MRSPTVASRTQPSPPLIVLWSGLCHSRSHRAVGAVYVHNALVATTAALQGFPPNVTVVGYGHIQR